MICLEKDKIYFNEFVKFYFMCKEKGINDMITIHFSILNSIFPKVEDEFHIFLEDYFLRKLSIKIKQFNEDIHGSNIKSTYGLIDIQNYDQTICKRSSFSYSKFDKTLNFYFKVRFPLKNNKINAKSKINVLQI